MPEELDAAPEELPPFSFLKKPIKNVFTASMISSTLNKSSGDKKPLLKPSLNNINYDEQIRAPRMSVANHYTYKPESPQPFTDRKSLTLSRSTSHELVLMLAQQKTESTEVENDTAATSAEQTSQYLPATADINQPTRRNLEPLKPRLGLISSAILTYANNNYFEQLNRRKLRTESLGNGVRPTTSGSKSQTSLRDHSEDNTDLLINKDLDMCSEYLDTTVLLEKLKLMRALDNLNTNTTTTERMESMKDDVQVGGRIRSPTMNAKGPGVQQVYNLKKPLCTPAVLRPMSKQGDEEMDDVDYSLGLEALSLLTQMPSCPFQVPDPGDELWQQEPTHEHWQPNNSTDHCMKCFGVFGSFFNPQKKRRHHCRFCGVLFCHDCLYKTKEMHYFEVAAPDEYPLSQSNGDRALSISRRAYSGSSNASSTTSALSLLEDTVTGVMMDSQARLVVPLFRNMAKEGASVLTLRERFKQCKVCRNCGHNYQKFVLVMNQRPRDADTLSALYVFVENPYMGSPMAGQAALTTSLSRTDQHPQVQERRASSLTSNVPSDWTWSSF